MSQKRERADYDEVKRLLAKVEASAAAMQDLFAEIEAFKEEVEEDIRRSKQLRQERLTILHIETSDDDSSDDSSDEDSASSFGKYSTSSSETDTSTESPQDSDTELLLGVSKTKTPEM